ncbi:MAG: NADH-quinone oxidoreductase subunit L, partial [Acidobacteriota bacterium]
RLARALAFPYKLLLNKYFVDELYFGAFIRPLLALCRGLWWWDRWIVDGIVNGARNLTVGASVASFAVDKYVVDGAGVNGTAATFQWLSRMNRKVQTGQFQHYALGVVGGFILLLVWYLYH